MFKLKKNLLVSLIVVCYALFSGKSKERYIMYEDLGYSTQIVIRKTCKRPTPLVNALKFMLQLADQT